MDKSYKTEESNKSNKIYSEGSKFNDSKHNDFYYNSSHNNNDSNKESSSNTTKENSANSNSNEISTIKEENENENEEEDEIIGKGGFSTVFKSKMAIAKKIYNKTDTNLYEKEKKYLKLLNNTEINNNIVKYYKSDDKSNILYLELCEGNLRQLREKIIKKHKHFPLFIIQNIINQLNKVMKYLIINLKIAYNDMKPENILYNTIDEEKDLYEIKLCDFNLVKENIKKMEFLIEFQALLVAWVMKKKMNMKKEFIFMTKFYMKFIVWGILCFFYFLVKILRQMIERKFLKLKIRIFNIF